MRNLQHGLLCLALLAPVGLTLAAEAGQPTAPTPPGTLQQGVKAAATAAEPIKVVYHIADGVEQAARALGNIRNHLQAEPNTKIVVVALSNGVDFLVEGAALKSGKPFEPTVAALASMGVEFRVCNNTLKGRDISPSKLLLESKVVPSGVAEIARLQAKEGYVYLRP
jgi:intracellular sulfur oxidation DsrE/DsrF family protein